MSRANFEGSVWLGRVHGGNEEDRARPNRIELIDELSGTRVTEIYLSDAALGKLVSSTMQVECRFAPPGDKIGKRYEHKTEQISFKTGNVYDEERLEKLARAACQPFEADGWSGQWRDLLNQHNFDNKTRTFRVRFQRWVDIAADEADHNNT